MTDRSKLDAAISRRKFVKRAGATVGGLVVAGAGAEPVWATPRRHDADVLKIAGQVVGKATFEPGWRWSNDVKPIAGTDSCQVSHLGYVLSGRMKVYMDDGSESEVAIVWISHNAANTTNIANQWNSPGDMSTRFESQSIGRPPIHRISSVVNATKIPSRTFKAISFDVIAASRWTRATLPPAVRDARAWQQPSR